MHLRTAGEAIGGTNQGHTFQFPPVTTPVHTVEVAYGMHTVPRSNGFNGRDLSNDLKVHDVSASSSSGLQMRDPYASVIIPSCVDDRSQTPPLAPSALISWWCSLRDISHPSQRPCPRLLDDLVREDKERRGNRNAEGLGSLEIDHKLEPHQLFYRQVARLSTFQDLVDVGGDLSTSHAG